MKISLTFDNGPHAVTTPFVLDALRDAGISATFFQVGKSLKIPEAASLIKRILSDGHSVGNHSLTHSIPLGLCDEEIAVTEISENQKLLAELDAPTTVFRPFGGGGNLNQDLLHPASVAYLTVNKMTCVTWNCVPRDWVDPHHWCERALQDIQLRDWSVVVLHDLADRGMEHLPRFIAEAESMGAEFRLDFPSDCVPIQKGEIMWDMSHLVSVSKNSAAFVAPAVSR